MSAPNPNAVPFPKPHFITTPAYQPNPYLGNAGIFTIGICSKGAITNPVFGSNLNSDGSPQALWNMTNAPAWDWGDGSMWLITLPLHAKAAALVGLTTFFVSPFSAPTQVTMGGMQPGYPLANGLARYNPDRGFIGNTIVPYSHTFNGVDTPVSFCNNVPAHLFADLPDVKSLSIGVNLYYNGTADASDPSGFPVNSQKPGDDNGFLQCCVSIAEWATPGQGARKAFSGGVYPVNPWLTPDISSVSQQTVFGPSPTISTASRGANLPWSAQNVPALARAIRNAPTGTYGSHLVYVPPSAPSFASQPSPPFSNDLSRAGWYYLLWDASRGAYGIAQRCSGISPTCTPISTDLSSAVYNWFPPSSTIVTFPGNSWPFGSPFDGDLKGYFAWDLGLVINDGLGGLIGRNLIPTITESSVSQNSVYQGTTTLPLPPTIAYKSTMVPGVVECPLFVGPCLPAITSAGYYKGTTLVQNLDYRSPAFTFRGFPYYSEVSMRSYPLYIFALGSVAAPIGRYLETV